MSGVATRPSATLGALTLLVALECGCGAPTVASDAGMDASVDGTFESYAVFCSAYAAARAPKLAACHGGEPADYLRLDIHDCGQGENRLESGPYRFDRAAAKECYANLQRLETCTAELGTCSAAIVGARGSDEACTSAECEPGLVCLLDSDGSCNRSCRQPQPPQPRPQNGEPCLTDVLQHCAQGLVCLATTSTVGRCIAEPGIGEACLDGWLCDDDLFFEKICDERALCMPLRSLGEACDPLAPCVRTLVCSSTRGACVEPARVGEPCGARPCGGVAFCSSHGTCALPALPGEACDEAPGSCWADHFCERTGSVTVCVPQKGLGALCSRSEECKEPLYCHEQFGVCAARGPGCT